MMTVCPVCGKLTCIHWPEHWVYRRGPTYYCSDQCMDVAVVREYKVLRQVTHRRRKEIAMRKITLEQKKKAVEIAISGENPLPYLKKCGSTAPDKIWHTIKAALKAKDPETYAKIPDFRLKDKEPENVPTVKLDGALRIETPEANKVEVVQKPENVVKVIQAPELKLKKGLRGLNNSDFDVSAIRHPVFGEFYYDQKFGMVDWRTPEGDEISLSPKAWKELYLLIPDVMGILGVPDDE